MYELDEGQFNKYIYDNKVIEETRSFIKNNITLKSFEEYIKTDEFEEDIKNNFRDGASVSACAYNLYMWI